MPVDFSVTNQLASPAIYASSLATRPAASFKGRLFVDTNNPSTGIYRDTGTAWVAIAGTGVAETQSLNDVCTVGNTTTTLGIIIGGDSSILTAPQEGYALTVGSSNLSIVTTADCTINSLNIGRGGGNLIENTAIGYQALNNNGGDGNNDTAVGNKALYLNSEGDNLVGIGYQALYNNTEGNANVAVGANTLYACNSGSSNTAIGDSALSAVTEGGSNIGIGYAAGNVVTGNNNIFLGQQAGLTTTSDNLNVVIGNNAIAPSGSNQFVVGSASYNVGNVSTEVNASSRVWNVVINGVARKILLA